MVNSISGRNAGVVLLTTAKISNANFFQAREMNVGTKR